MALHRINTVIMNWSNLARKPPSSGGEQTPNRTESRLFIARICILNYFLFCHNRFWFNLNFNWLCCCASAPIYTRPMPEFTITVWIGHRGLHRGLVIINSIVYDATQFLLIVCIHVIRTRKRTLETKWQLHWNISKLVWLPLFSNELCTAASTRGSFILFFLRLCSIRACSPGAKCNSNWNCN